MKTTVYLNQPTEERFKRIKAGNPDYSLSEAVEVGLKFEEERISTQLTGMVEQIAMKGTEDRGEFYGTKAKFVGRRLARERVAQVGEETYEWQTIYLTKKGKYLLQVVTENERFGQVRYDYDICNTLKDLQEKASAVVLSKAGSTAGEFLPDLDI